MNVKRIQSDLQGIRRQIGPLTIEQVIRFVDAAAPPLRQTFEAIRAERPVDWLELHRVSRLFPLLEDHRAYETTLLRSDPGLDLPVLQEARFIGRGNGEGSLNCYRRAKLGGRPVFEKVYLRDSDAWAKLTWFHFQMLPRLGDRIRTPRIVEIAEGDRIAVAYFTFEAGTRAVLPEQLLAAGLTLQGIRAEIPSDPPLIEAVTDFRREVMYRAGVKSLQRLLARAGTDTGLQRSCEARILQDDIPRCLAHGDLIPENLLADGRLLDFDKCGVYPAGYDAAYLMSKAMGIASVEAFEAFAEAEIIRECPGTRLSLFYFACVYYSRKIRVELPDDLILALFERLMQHMQADDGASCAA